ncbi:class IV adenylate cyclase [Pontibacter sp. G13]|uniref:class IV adenylate cyclase n=1 Tax=Pontibacter sp. G13 TaxID=3074898 RepID=UPI00288A3002|nr:class IV adenylate cyclase [Pontibacter sp. G13]WNJ17272.1 class IV adenylate cyclase [Pontibacter sp. G13]
MHLNIEIKARTSRADFIREFLEQQGARYEGLDHQIDTYFQVPNGRMKLREGTIERNLIHYSRPDQAGPKASHVHLYRPNPGPALKELLTEALGIWKVVDKQRKIYFIQNVKFHIDEVRGLGSFVEIEAIDLDGSIGESKLQEQCQHYLAAFEIPTSDLVSGSYSDLIPPIGEGPGEISK